MDKSVDIKALRARLGWSQEKLGDYVGLNRSQISRIENGAPTSGPVLRLLETLERESVPQPEPVS